MLKPFLVIIFVSLLVSSCGGGGGSSPGNDSVTSIPGRISWTPPTMNTDDSELTDLEKYRIYYGPSENELSAIPELDFAAKGSSGNLISQLYIDDLSSEQIQLIESKIAENDTHFFALTAINSQFLESDLSNIVEYIAN